MKARVEAILTGRAQIFRGSEHSAIAKSVRIGPVQISTLGIEGDEQADPKHHGGPHMALHLYPQEHHQFWGDTIGPHQMLQDPGAFGSNLAVRGMLENAVHIGDRFRLGSALIEVSQPRKPCWKIEHRFDQKGMVETIVKTGKSGWYFRVIAAGQAQADDMLERFDTGNEDWTIARSFRALWGDPKNVTAQELTALAEIEALSPKLREEAALKASRLPQHGQS